MNGKNLYHSLFAYLRYAEESRVGEELMISLQEPYHAVPGCGIVSDPCNVEALYSLLCAVYPERKWVVRYLIEMTTPKQVRRGFQRAYARHSVLLIFPVLAMTSTPEGMPRLSIYGYLKPAEVHLRLAASIP